jgi:hypothetical protein
VTARRAPDGPRPASRIADDGTRQVARTWESLVERQIREAMDEGKFDDLPFRGQPIPIEDETLAGEWALAFRVLRNAKVAPPWIESDKAVRALLERRDVLLARAAGASPLARRRERAELEALIVAINAAVARLNAEAPTDRQHRRPVDPIAELARYDELVRS